MPWEKITNENIVRIKKGDKIANGSPKTIIDTDSRTGAEKIQEADIKVFIVTGIEKSGAEDEYNMAVSTTIWSFSLEGTDHLTEKELLEKWWWKPAP
ncbi:MAG: hypothetical protein ACTHLE_08955 [Agriterribacter sp.]